MITPPPEKRDMQTELNTFNEYIAEQGLNSSSKRDCIARVFLSTNGHLSAEELYGIARKEYPAIGQTTVYRTLKLMCDCGLAKVTDFGDGVRRYERKVGREHHAHFICSSCGRSLEVFDDRIAGTVKALAKKQQFLPQSQRFEIFGLCKDCQGKTKNKDKPGRNR